VTRRCSVAEAKAHFADCLRAVEAGGAVVITRHGREIAALVSARDLEKLSRLRAAGPEGGLAAVAGGWPGSDTLVETISASSRRRRSRRKTDR
jgi:prevent-host-death family protein